MKRFDFARETAAPIQAFESVGAAGVRLARGRGETRVHAIYFEPGGVIGPHPTGFAQLFLVVAGSGWVAGADGVRHPLEAGRGAYFDKGELHSKGSEDGMTVVMLQVDELDPELQALELAPRRDRG